MNDKILNIQDVSLLKVTRVRDWSICFSYDGKNYLIHGCYECGEGSWQDFYTRELDEKGRYTLDFIKCSDGDEQVKYYYFDTAMNKTLVYSRINKNDFAYMLTKNGFATGVYADLVEKENLAVDELRTKLKEISNQDRIIRSEIHAITGKKKVHY